MSPLVDGLPTDDVSVLTLLSQAARDAIAFRRTRPREFVETLPKLTRAAINRVHDGDRIIGEEHFLFAQLIALSDAALERYDRTRAIKINRAIVAMLPDMQDDGLRAMELREQARPTP